MKAKLLAALCAVPLCTGFAADAEQAKSAELIKYRQSAMMYMRWNLRKIRNQVVKDPQTYNKDQVLAAATALDSAARSGLGTLFKPGTQAGKGWKETRLKADFFEQNDEAQHLLETLRKQTAELVTAADSGDTARIEKQFKATFSACKNCHRKFRRQE